MNDELINAYRFCPLCGSKNLVREKGALACQDCGHRDFNNPIAAVAVFLFDEQDRVLLILRAKEPGKGKWAPPGGFIDGNETLEEAAVREIAEETGVVLHDLRYLGSFPNLYVYHGLGRPVCDTYFTARTNSSAVKIEEEEVSAFQWRKMDEINGDELAFISMRRAFALLRSQRSS